MNKQRFLRCILLLLLTLIACVGSAKETKEPVLKKGVRREVASGITVEEYQFGYKNQPMKAGHKFVVMEFSPSAEVQFAMGLKSDWVHGQQKTSLMAKAYEEKTGRRVLAAFNGDFFDINAGGPLGFNMKEGRWVTSSEFPQGSAWGITADGRVKIGTPKLEIRISAYRGEAALFEAVPVDALNALRSDCVRSQSFPQNAFLSRKDNHLVLYTPDYFPSTMTMSGGCEVGFHVDGILSSNSRCEGEVYDVVTGKAHSKRGMPLPAGSMVLSAPGGAALDLSVLSAGDRIVVETLVDEAWADVILSLGGGRPDGGPLLIKDGIQQKDQAFVEDYASFYGPHPRTAAAKRKDGSYFLLYAPGVGGGGGLRIEELKQVMLLLGAQDAVNLDGGSSSTMVLRQNERLTAVFGLDGRKNTKEIPVGNTLLVLEKKNVP